MPAMISKLELFYAYVLVSKQNFCTASSLWSNMGLYLLLLLLLLLFLRGLKFHSASETYEADFFYLVSHIKLCLTSHSTSSQ